MPYTPGSLVRARDREWVVLPDSTDDWLILRPLGGTDREIAGIYLPLEGSDVQPATFDLPDPAHPGDFSSCRLLRDAVRLGFRSSAGPFRSFGRLNVEPRPYQLVPLIMALRLEPVRLLIADDVGIGKTIEAGLIARELLDRTEARRLTVLCPPHLAEQWQSELSEKFHIDAELVLPSTVSRLERDTAMGQSLFDLYPYTVVSTDYIKAAPRREEFLRTCPELVIVDEAHTCAFSQDQRGGRHLRHQLLRELAAQESRHLILVTATPHSGNVDAFRSLLALLKPDFRDLPDDLTGAEQAGTRRALAAHLVQRRRADVRDYLGADTPFPEREEKEESYSLSPEYKKLFEAVLAYARERVRDPSGDTHRQRVRWWSALALLRSLGSSPAAAASTLRNRSATADTSSAEEADDVGERSVLDLDDPEATEFADAAPGALEEEEEVERLGQRPAAAGGMIAAGRTVGPQRERLLRLARTADGLRGPQHDAKLARGIRLVQEFVEGGFNPILFCRFIPTADYVAGELRKALPKDVEVAAVTGTLPPAERELRVQQLGEHARRVLVATDCLSEGINLQDHFDAVMHYDLSWNPTRHEQREGRVDRFGQPSPTVRAMTYYGMDNQIDGLVLDVLLRKHRKIRSALGISVPVPASSSDVLQALVQGLLLRGPQVDARQLALPTMEEAAYRPLHDEWDRVSEKEKRSRTLFAQRSIDASEVQKEWDAVRAAIGASIDVERFVRDVVTAHGGAVTPRPAGRIAGVQEIRLPNLAPLREACGHQADLRVRFELPVPDGVLHLGRTHPVVEGLAAYTMDTALDPLLAPESVARRCGVIRTRAVEGRTTLLLVRMRFHIVSRRGTEETALLAEDCQLLGFSGSPDAAQWLAPEQAELLLAAQPAANIAPQQASDFLRRVTGSFDPLRAPLNEAAVRRSQELLEAHRRVRSAARLRDVRVDVRPHLPPDVLGVYVLLPAGV